MITANGIIIRTGLDEIRSIGRNTQGVRLIKLKEGDKLVAVEKIAPENGQKHKENSGENDLLKAVPAKKIEKASEKPDKKKIKATKKTEVTKKPKVTKKTRKKLK